MFGWRKKKVPEVVAHWYLRAPDFTSSVGEFYDAVEAELEKREMPGLEASRLILSDGGILVPRREYLRLCREQIVFDVCSAPFGTAWFFSCRTARIPKPIRIWELLILLYPIAGLYFGYVHFFGLAAGIANLVIALVVLLAILHIYSRSPARDFDSILLKTPGVGALYDLFLRRHDSYYREDARLLYMDTVNEVVREVVEEFSGAKFSHSDSVKYLDSSPYRFRSQLTPPDGVEPTATAAPGDVGAP